MTDIRTDEVKVAITDLPDASPSDPLEALSWLGDTVEEIAEGLRARGIKGRISDTRSCPLHNYLAAFGFDYAVTGASIYRIEDDELVWEDILTGQYALTEFVGRFDGKSFPDLIDNG